ncbi:MAG: hypothetical protein GC152_13970 [Alphaproteobacteria bacterium]|nr:hypothetical protein [Alphaproteobacteria bacterium]
MSTNDEGKKKGLNPMVAMAAAAAIAVASGVAAFALSPVGGGAAEHEPTSNADHKEHESHGGAKSSSSSDGHGKKKKRKATHGAELVYVPIEPLIVSLGPEAAAKRLKITIVIEGDAAFEDELKGLVPKFRDVLNTYLRAADARDFESPAAMSRVRAHIARRLKIVAPDESIEGVLVTDFILD